MTVQKLKIIALVCLLASIGAVGAAEEKLQGRWVLAIGEDPVTYETVVSLQQDSATSIKDEYATKDVVPRLALRCTPGKPVVTARIDWGRFISSFNTELGFSVDGGKRLWLKWGVDRSEKITTSPSTEDSQRLIDELTGGNEVEVEISPYSEGPVTALFDLAAFDDAMTKLLASCS